MKRITKHIKTRLKIVCIALLLLSVAACDKNDDQDKTDDTFAPTTDQGVNLKMTYPNGDVVYPGGDAVYGWFQGMLLGGNKLREVRGGGEGFGFRIRINMPMSTQKSEIIGVTQTVIGPRLLLENSMFIDIYPELYFSKSDIDVFENATGVIKIIETDDYDIIGEVDAQIYDISGQIIKVTGFFWKKVAQPYDG